MTPAIQVQIAEMASAAFLKRLVGKLQCPRQGEEASFLAQRIQKRVRSSDNFKPGSREPAWPSPTTAQRIGAAAQLRVNPRVLIRSGIAGTP